MMWILVALLACKDKPAPTSDVKLPDATAPATPGEPTAPTGEAAPTANAPQKSPYFDQAPKVPVRNDTRMAASHILVTYQGSVGALPNVTRTREEARARAEEVRAQVMAGGDFAALAKSYSDDSSADRGGYLGGANKGAWVEPFENAVRGLQPGGISGIVETPFGFHVIRREPLVELRAAHLMVSWKGAPRAPDGVKRTKDEAKARAEEALAKVKANGDWKSIVSEYSDTPLNGDAGDLGWLSRGQIAPALENALFDLAPGGTSEVVETPIGYHVLRRTE